MAKAAGVEIRASLFSLTFCAHCELVPISIFLFTTVTGSGPGSLQFGSSIRSDRRAVQEPWWRPGSPTCLRIFRGVYIQLIRPWTGRRIGIWWGYRGSFSFEAANRINLEGSLPLFIVVCCQFQHGATRLHLDLEIQTFPYH